LGSTLSTSDLKGAGVTQGVERYRNEHLIIKVSVLGEVEGKGTVETRGGNFALSSLYFVLSVVKLTFSLTTKLREAFMGDETGC
jgi:hypothetical protein